MTVTLEKLVAKGIDRIDAVIEFKPLGNLVRGPSDTGKSHIRDCLWYLLGGEKAPKAIPENRGYDTLLLQLRSNDGGNYTIRRGLDGGATAVYPSTIEDLELTEALPDEIGTLLVSFAGAAGMLVLRSMSKRGPLTAGDLRHWFLVSQPAMISENSTIGTPTEQPQRRASFCVFLTGQDDKAVVLATTKDEKLKIKANILTIQNDLKRVNAELPEGSSMVETKEALERVDATFSLLSAQQGERSKQLRGIREQLNELSVTAGKVHSKLAYSTAMVARFELLDKKYESDFTRLVAISDGIAVFDALDDQPCPLCKTPVKEQTKDVLLSLDATRLQRAAMQAEANKISALRKGLVLALERESQQRNQLQEYEEALHGKLESIAKAEHIALNASREEFSVDPKTLAIRRSELYSQTKLFDEFQRLTAELERLNALVPTKAAPLSRRTELDGSRVASYTLNLLHTWGLTSIQTAELDAVECDIRIDGRPRLSYGAGMRSIFLTAMTVALLKHSMSRQYPHLGLVVLDSPMKSYSDPKNSSDVTVSPVTVKDAFYSWLASWEGPGQVIVLENELISEETALRLKPTEFTKSLTEGRYGFYPLVDVKTLPSTE
jgi:hypothetical protein